jgi:uncharacterized protein (DUF1697 family)
MPVYVSMLRGVNLGAHNRMKMAELREVLTPLGCQKVQTYIQSGNVIYRAAKQSRQALSKKIEESLLQRFGFSVPVLTRTAREMKDVIQSNPFLKESGVDLSKLHVTFLPEVPGEAGLKIMRAIDAGPDRCHSVGDVIYLFCPNSYSETRLSNGFLEKTFSVRATTRNWRTVNKLYDLALECA